MAKQYSEDPSAARGGDLGYFGSAQVSLAFEAAAFSLQPGQVSGIVTIPFGYHLIKVYDRKPAGMEPFANAQPQLKARLESERWNAPLHQLMDRLKSRSEIKRFDPEAQQ